MVHTWSADPRLHKTFEGSNKREEAQAYIESIKPYWDQENADRNSDIDSVVSDGRFDIHLEESKPAPFPAVRPHYE